MFNNENKPRFACAAVVDRIRASPRDLNGSDPNWYGYSIRSRRVRIADPELDQIEDEVSSVRKAYPLQFGSKPKRIRSRVHGAYNS